MYIKGLYGSYKSHCSAGVQLLLRKVRFWADKFKIHESELSVILYLVKGQIGNQKQHQFRKSCPWLKNLFASRYRTAKSFFYRIDSDTPPFKKPHWKFLFYSLDPSVRGETEDLFLTRFQVRWSVCCCASPITSRLPVISSLESDSLDITILLDCYAFFKNVLLTMCKYSISLLYIKRA